ncbi:MFS transporter, aromatic acid:H+ symporter (AAHS) family (plasmid) [Neorhizobium galegae bv. officinalis bv. officinalis str. HAMBI 1141]|uniref:MFS transporter, aromatic acid:H+ symporter (AAHS) family n=1 Tax=Neorhizobium galegae bv. officinalis bv. officinalis str. HAMBI 1141 TaxID=1028801 RepID=A0A068TKF8_NEOGA|nr:MFS transporter [Neorhizobium galegae]CDN58050.1 MFS transporter, aromatic acid:H+ symporter (AAHS) family [Neorhizobium galegae bv. officinalis bv. officinalis str. HAMBI 1141]
MNIEQRMAAPSPAVDTQAEISARLERLPVTREVFWARNIVGAATFFDGYTVIAIAYAMPVLVREWGLTPGQTGMILSMGYLGQLIGAICFGWLAERIGRLKVLLFTILLFVSMDVACLFAAGAGMMMALRFIQGIGTGGEVPVASAYINELISSKGRGRFFLLYEVMFLLGLVGAGLIGYFMVPAYGWKAMFVVGLIPAVLMIPLRWFLNESPRWLAANGRYEEADRIVTTLENSARAAGKELPEPKIIAAPVGRRSDWRELFQGIYLKRTLSIWAMWFCAYMVANGTITWLPTLYRQTFNLPLETSILYGFITSVGGVIAAVICALLIDKVGRKRWYTGALLIAPVPLVILAWLGATSATQVLILAGLAYAIVQTVTFSLYLYSAEIYPTRLRAIGTGTGSAWLRLGSSAGPIAVGWVMSSMGIQYVFGAFAAILLVGALVTAFFAVETKGQVLEELSP